MESENRKRFDMEERNSDCEMTPCSRFCKYIANGGERNTDDEMDIQEMIQFLWKKRLFVLGIILLMGIFAAWHLRTVRQNEERKRAEHEEQLNGEFASVNLNRISRGVYRLRVEVFGDHENPRREDTYIDFDRDLMITIYEHEELGNVLAFNLESLREDIEVVGFVLRGRLRNRERNYRINLVNVQTDYLSLGYREISHPLPISIHTAAGDYNEIELNNFDWLHNMEEFRNYFELTFFEMTLYMPDLTEEKLQVRYMASSNIYETRVGAEINEPEEDEGEGEPE